LDSQDRSAAREAFRQPWLTINGILPVTEPTPSWQIEFYEREEGGCPVQDFLNALDKPPRAKVLALVRLLAEQGPTLPFPYSSQVRGKIRELRTRHGRENLRVLYFGSAIREWVLLHGFTKRTPQTSERDIRIAEARMTEYLDRQKRIGP
jgi:phage-related protein